jgi:hypothetical protein
MKMERAGWIVLSTLVVLGLTACSGGHSTPTPDTVGTAVAQLAVSILTQTAAAASPTPSRTPTPRPTATSTATITPTSGPPRPPLVIAFAGCWKGPGENYELVSHISQGTRVDLYGIGSVPGWFLIINPYFRQVCWIQAANLSIHAGTDMSKYPVMTPPAP